MSNYNNTVQIRDNKINFRKWKVKDRKKFIKTIITAEDYSTADEAQRNLVWDCLEDKSIVLTPDEFRYVFVKMREVSIGKSIMIDLVCSECDAEIVEEADLDKIIKPVGSLFAPIVVDELILEIGDVINREFYDSKMKDSSTTAEIYLMDFMLHIKKINQNDTFTFEELNNTIDDMDIDVLDKVLDQWDAQKFKIDDTYEITCANCQNTELYSFDEIPNLIPESWYSA